MNNPSQKDPATSARGSLLASNYTSSLLIDRRLFREDIAGSIAHVQMLSDQGIIPSAGGGRVIAALNQVLVEISTGVFKWRNELEDIHMNIESRVFELAGDAAGYMHTARSRNDQIATDVRVWTRNSCDQVIAQLRTLQAAIVDRAEEQIMTIMPGYSHLQRGQPVLLAHHLLAYFEMLERDITRFAGARVTTDVLPLGSGALAGVPYPIDRQFLAKQLGFARISENSIDAVSDRDFIIEFVSASAMCAMHLSRLAEEFVVWSTEEFGFIRLDAAFTTGSSIMPQKRNPDFAELMRGRVGRNYGSLINLLTVMKGLPLSYNRDMQEDKESLFGAFDSLVASLESATGMFKSLEFDIQRMREAAESSDILATDLADYLVTQGMPFREAHIVVSELSTLAHSRGAKIADLEHSDLAAVSPKFFNEGGPDLTLESSIASRDVPGGTATCRVRNALRRARSKLVDAETN